MTPRVAVVVAFALLVSSIAFVSCDARDNDVTAPQVDVRQYVTGEAANRLHPDGSFRLQEEFTSATEDVITTERAVDLAKAYLKTWGPIFERDWEAEYEGSIDLKKLRLDPRIILAETAFGQFPAGYHPSFKRFFGPHYILVFKQNSQPVLVLSLSAYMTDYQIDNRGDFVLPKESGSEVLSQTVRRRGRILLLPEVAVELVWRATGARATNIPERVWTGDPGERNLYFGTRSLWKISLEYPVTLKTADTGVEVRTSQILVDNEGRFLVGRGEQPASLRTYAMRLMSDQSLGPAEPVELSIREGRPVRLTVANAVAQ